MTTSSAKVAWTLLKWLPTVLLDHHMLGVLQCYTAEEMSWALASGTVHELSLGVFRSYMKQFLNM